MATIMRIQEFWDKRLGTLEVYVGAGIVLLCIVCVFACIALFDNLGQSYRMRRDEFVLYRLSGMSRGRVALMKSTEIALSLLFGLAMALVGMMIFFPAMNAIFLSFAFDNVLGLKNFLGLI